MLCLALILGQATPSLALAPPSAFSGEDSGVFSKGEIAVQRAVRRISNALGVSEEAVREALLSHGLPAYRLIPLLHALRFLFSNKILPHSHAKHLRAQPLRRATKMLLALAWQTEFSDPWRVRVSEELPPEFAEVWDRFDLRDTMERIDAPGRQQALLIDSIFQTTAFSLASFYDHVQLRGVEPTTRELIAEIAAMDTESGPLRAHARAAQIVLNPHISAEIFPLLRRHHSLPGFHRVLQNLEGLWPRYYGDYSGITGFVYELAHLDATFATQGYRPLEMGVEVRGEGKTITEIDLLVEKDSEMYIGEVKVRNREQLMEIFHLDKDPTRDAKGLRRLKKELKRIFKLTDEMLNRLNPEATPQQWVLDAWAMFAVERKLTLLFRGKAEGLLQPMLDRHGIERFGGVIFSLHVGEDPEFQEIIRRRAAEVAGRYGVRIEVHFPVMESLVLTQEEVLAEAPHARRADHTLETLNFRYLRLAFHHRFNRELLREHQRYIRESTGVGIGTETLRWLVGTTRNKLRGAHKLIAQFGLQAILEARHADPHGFRENLAKSVRKPKRPDATHVPTEVPPDDSAPASAPLSGPKKYSGEWKGQEVSWDMQTWIETMREAKRIPWSTVPKEVLREVLTRFALFQLGKNPDELTVHDLKNNKVEILGGISGFDGLLKMFAKKTPEGVRQVGAAGHIQLKQSLGLMRWNLRDVITAQNAGMPIPWKSLPPLTKLLLVENAAKAAGKPLHALKPDDFDRELWTAERIRVSEFLEQHALQADGSIDREAGLKALLAEVREIKVPYTQAWEEKLRRPFGSWADIPFAIQRRALQIIGDAKGKELGALSVEDIHDPSNYFGRSFEGLLRTYHAEDKQAPLPHVLATVFSGHRWITSMDHLKVVSQWGHEIQWRNLRPLTRLLIVENVAKSVGKPVSDLTPADFSQPVWTLENLNVEPMVTGYIPKKKGATPEDAVQGIVDSVRQVKVRYSDVWEAKLRGKSVRWYEIPLVIQRIMLGRMVRNRGKALREWGSEDFRSEDNYLGKRMVGLMRSFAPKGSGDPEARRRMLEVLTAKEPWVKRYDDPAIVEKLAPRRVYNENFLGHPDQRMRLRAFRPWNDQPAQAEIAVIGELLSGNRAARQALAEGVGPLVLKLANKYQVGYLLTYQEAVAAGFDGALQAAARYQPLEGVKFATFAYHRIRGAMLREKDRKLTKHWGLPFTLVWRIKDYRALQHQIQKGDPGRKHPTVGEILTRMPGETLSVRHAERLAEAMRRGPIGALPGSRPDSLAGDRVRLISAFEGTPPDPAEGLRDILDETPLWPTHTARPDTRLPVESSL